MAIKSALKYLKEVRAEFARVVYPRMEDLIGSSIIVVVIMCAFSLYLGALDIGFSRLFHRIFSCWTC